MRRIVIVLYLIALYAIAYAMWVVLKSGPMVEIDARIVAALLGALASTGITEFIRYMRNRNMPVSRRVRWVPEKPGMQVEGRFLVLRWSKVEKDLKEKVFPQVNATIPEGATVRYRDLNQKKNWILRLYGPDGTEIGKIWIGGNPESHYSFDGQIWIKMSHKGSYDIFQRFSDGSYRRMPDQPSAKSIEKP